MVTNTHSRRDPERLARLELVVAELLKQDNLRWGYQTKLAGYFGVTRQRVQQVVAERRRRQEARLNSVRWEERAR